MRLMIESKDNESKSLVREFVNYVHIKDPLRKQFKIYNQLNSSFVKDKESAKMYIDECVSTLSPFGFEDIQGYNALLETRFRVPKMKSTDVNHHIANIIRYRTSREKDNLLEAYISSYGALVDHLTSIRKEPDSVELEESLSHSTLLFLKPQHVVKIALKKFNGEYGQEFDQKDRQVFYTLKEGDQTKIEKLWKDIVSESVTLKNEVYDSLDDELKGKLDEALTKTTSGYTESNLLDVYEIVCELREIRG